ncbi:hypothetical protein FOCG_02290 [Fusarium oxysporum f. sp. radicis-lycopersici 26381]|nr:hypothetical protein FOCG_02290 [Fusarium oxysporum f. sp. radicis-lycopersici 26381]
MLVQLKAAHKGLTEYMRQEDIDDAPPGDTDAQALAQVPEWYDSFNIADESVWFLGIVAIALTKVIIRSITIRTVADTTIPTPPHHQKGNPSCTVACPPASQDTDGPRLNLQFASVGI